MLEVTIGRAMVLRKRTAAKIAKLEQRITQNNSTIKGAKRDLKVLDALDERGRLVGQLKEIKFQVFEGSRNVRAQIIELGELKAQIQFLRGIDCKQGPTIDRFGRGDLIEMEAVVSQQMVDDWADILEEEIDRIQEELNEFNRRKKIKLETFGEQTE